MTYRFSIKKEIASVTVIARYEAISFLGILYQKIASIVPLSQWRIVFDYQRNNLGYRLCEVRSNLIVRCSKSKDCFNRTSFAMTYRFSIKKERTSVTVFARGCEVRSKAISLLGILYQKIVSIIPLSQWRIVFRLSKKYPLLPSLRGTKQSHYYVFYIKRLLQSYLFRNDVSFFD
jgi:hypothetical protein